MLRKKIMLIDDEEGFTSMLRLNLESRGDYEICVENNPAKALSSILIHRPDLVLLDVIMPKMEGPDVAAEIKNNSEVAGTPIVFLTATVTEQEVAAQGGRIGGHAFVAKPASVEKLLATIEENIP